MMPLWVAGRCVNTLGDMRKWAKKKERKKKLKRLSKRCTDNTHKVKESAHIFHPVDERSWMGHPQLGRASFDVRLSIGVLGPSVKRAMYTHYKKKEREEAGDEEERKTNWLRGIGLLPSDLTVFRIAAVTAELLFSVKHCGKFQDSTPESRYNMGRVKPRTVETKRQSTQLERVFKA